MLKIKEGHISGATVGSLLLVSVKGCYFHSCLIKVNEYVSVEVDRTQS